MSRRAALVLAFLVSGVLLAATIWALEPSAFLAALGRARADWLALAGGLVLLAALLRALRWRIAAGAPAGLAVFWRAANLGNLGNAIYPLRAGEAIRIGALARAAALDPAEAAASSALDRAAEGAALLAVGAPALLLAAPALQTPPPLVMVGAAALLGASILLVSRFEAPRAAAGRFLSSLRRLARARSMLPALTLTALAYACDIGFTWAVLQALQLDVGFAAAVLTNVFLVFAGLLPAAPAGLGAHQAASAVALGLFGIGAGEALAFSALAQAVTVAGALLLGLEALRGGSLRRASAAG